MSCTQLILVVHFEPVSEIYLSKMTSNYARLAIDGCSMCVNNALVPV